MSKPVNLWREPSEVTDEQYSVRRTWANKANPYRALPAAEFDAREAERAALAARVERAEALLREAVTDAYDSGYENAIRHGNARHGTTSEERAKDRRETIDAALKEGSTR